MHDERLTRLTRLVRVREQRTRARERDRSERRRSRVSAEEALARQEATLRAAQTDLDRSVSQVYKQAAGSALTGDEMASFFAHLATKRTVIATERSAVAAAETVCNVLRAEEDKARAALRAASNAQRKAEALHIERGVEHRRIVRVAAELADDELSAMRAAAVAARGH